jgi:hypothetical protein
MSCAKTVVDFTAMLPEEVHFFIQNQSQNICGRMKKSQLDSITIQIPVVLYKQTQYHKMFFVAYCSSQWEPLCLVVPIKRKQTKLMLLKWLKDTTKHK